MKTNDLPQLCVNLGLPLLRPRRALRAVAALLTLAVLLAALGVPVALAQDGGSISGRVTNDLDGVGIAGVTVELWQESNSEGGLQTGGDTPDTLVDDTTTAGDGSYSFTIAENGSYYIRVLDGDGPLVGWSLTGGGANPRGPIGVADGTSTSNVNFRYTAPATGTIGGRVFNALDDASVNADVTVHLMRDTNADGIPDVTDATATVLSGSTNYAFSDRPAASNYYVRVEDGGGATLEGWTTPTNPIGPLNLSVGGTIANIDFGYTAPTNSSISGRVYNTVDDSTTNVNVTVELWRDTNPCPGLQTEAVDCAGDEDPEPPDTLVTNVIVAPGATDFAFEDLSAASNYYVRVVDGDGSTLAGWTLTAGTNPVPIDLPVEDDITDVDFGYTPPSNSSISGRVFTTLTDDGIGGVTVRLLRDSVEITTTTTAGDGTFSFASLQAATDYAVEVVDTSGPLVGWTLASGYTNPNSPIVVEAGAAVSSIDFGYDPPTTSAITGRVYNQLDNAGISGVTVQLFRGSTQERETTTGGDGSYTFGSLPAAVNYEVRVVDTIAPLIDWTTPTNTNGPINLGEGDTVSNIDFGYTAPSNSTITGRVYNVLDNASLGVAVTVQLYRGDTLIPPERILSAGQTTFTFNNIPAASNYSVRVVEPITNWTLVAGTNPNGPITVGAGATVSDIDFGYQAVANSTISGRVYNALTDGPTGVALTVELWRDTDGDDTPDHLDITATIGPSQTDFSFPDRRAATNYFVRVIETATSNPLEDQPAWTRTVGDNPNGPISLGVGATVSNINFGYQVGGISGRVYNTVTDGATGVELTVQLWSESNNCPGLQIVPEDCDGDGSTDPADEFVDDVTITGSNYTFSELPDGVYYVRVILAGTGNPGDLLEDEPEWVLEVGSNPTALLAVSAETPRSNVNFGYTPGTIGGVIFNDLNGNNQLNSGEELEDVLVELVKITGGVLDPDTFRDEQRTDENGEFLFSLLSLTNSDYALFFTLPPGLEVDAVLVNGVSRTPQSVEGGLRVDITVDDGDPVADVQIRFAPIETPSQANPAIIKSVGGITTAMPGQNVTFTLTLNNTGTEAAQNVVVTDQMSAYLTSIVPSFTSTNPGTIGSAQVNVTGLVTYTFTAVQPGDIITMTITARVIETAPAGQLVQNFATVAFEGGTQRQSNTVSFTIGSPLQLIKSASVQTAAPGQNVTFTLAFQNLSAQIVTGVIVRDVFNPLINLNSASLSPADRGTFSIDLATRTVTFNITSVNPGETITMTVYAQVSPSATVNTQLPNTATFTTALDPFNAISSNTVIVTVSGVPLTPTSSTIIGPSVLPQTGGRPAQGADSAGVTTDERVLYLSLFVLALAPALGLVLLGLREGRPSAAWARLALGGLAALALLLGVLAAASEQPLMSTLQVAAGIAVLAVMAIALASILRSGLLQPRDRAVAVALSALTVLALVASPLVMGLFAPAPAELDAELALDSETGGEEVAAQPTLAPDLWEEGTGDDGDRAAPHSEVIRSIGIPALNLNRPVVEAAYEGDSWNITSFDREVAHLQGTGYPGPTGNTVLAGHVTLTRGGFGPFKDLHRLIPGDVIVLYGPENQYVYRVDAVETVAPDAIELTHPTEEPTLTLVTCINWSARQQQYVDRLVVRASLMPERSEGYY